MNQEQKILRKIISKYRLERSDTENGKWWWIIKEPNEVLCELTQQETIIVWDEVKHEFSMNVHKITIDNGGHDIYFCYRHLQEVRKGIRK